jgi:integrase
MPVLKLTLRNVVEKCLPIPGKRQAVYWDVELKGFALCVGQTGVRSFFVKKHKKTTTIGRTPPWTPELARKRAAEIIIDMDRGLDPGAERRKKRALGLTLAKALAEHLSRLKAKGGSARTIEDMKYEVEHYLGDWMPRPLAALERSEVRTRHKSITTKNGAYVANRVLRYFSAIYNSARKTHEIPEENPTIAVEWNKERRRQEPIAWAELPAWAGRVAGLDPVLRDYLHVVLFTGLRSEDAATMRWEELNITDEEDPRFTPPRPARSLFRPNPKGGEERAFTAPLPGYVVEILRRRKAEAGEDGGWVFPGRSIKGKPPAPIIGRRWGAGRGESPHRLRDTYTTACAEAGLNTFDIDVLTNHRPPKGTVTAGYVNQNFPHLAECQEKVAALILRKLNP